MRTVRPFFFVGLCLVGCQRYQPAPLSPEEVVLDVAQERKDVEDAPFTFVRATALMARHGPSLKESRAEYETVLAIAKVKTPLPNPALGIGPQYGFGPDVDDYRLRPFASIGFAIPTGPRRSRQDDMNRLSAELALVGMQATHRELYLGLRRLYAEWILTRSRLSTRKTLAEAAEKSLTTGRKLAETGFASPLDMGLLELETARVRSEILNARRELAGIEGELSETLGVQAGLFQAPPDPALPELPQDDVALQTLTAWMLANHPALARLRAR
jgi:outer membrane protein TolC